MTPLEFLREECENVERALGETLRHDYGPERSDEYFSECQARLNEIKSAVGAISSTNLQDISAYLAELSSLASWIYLIERSHLGEFSWPFADELRRIAKVLFTETALNRQSLEPIIHIVAEGQDYQIVYESKVPAASGNRRFIFVAFPRSLKHHVLLHALFGHELGHTALSSPGPGGILLADVIPALTRQGPMQDEVALSTWINDASAPQEIQNTVQRYGMPFVFDSIYREYWLDEIICDLFGLLLFGPSFLAAHRTLLQSMDPSPYQFDLSDPTHPPYAVRHKMLVRAMKLLHWNTPVTNSEHSAFHQAEIALLDYILDDSYVPWAVVFDDNQLIGAIEGINKILVPSGSLGYTTTNADTLVALVSRLANGAPPVVAEIDHEGKPLLSKIEISQTLYAGWVYWVGRNCFQNVTPYSFFITNRLCNHALLQQNAINEAVDAGIV